MSMRKREIVFNIIVIVLFQEFESDKTDNVAPFVSYFNHLYLYPKSLKYDCQKSFTKVSV